MISLPLKSHRVRFKTYPFTFTTEEALQNMANLRLTQTNRMDDPKVCLFSYHYLLLRTLAGLLPLQLRLHSQ